MLKDLALATFLSFAPLTAFAHGAPPAAAHGGQVAEDSAEHWVEIVIGGDQLRVYVLDEDKHPIPSAQLGGKATVLIGGKSQNVPLTAGDGNSLVGSLSAPAAGKTTTVLSLTVSGKPAQVRFTTSQ